MLKIIARVHMYIPYTWVYEGGLRNRRPVLIEGVEIWDLLKYNITGCVSSIGHDRIKR